MQLRRRRRRVLAAVVASAAMVLGMSGCATDTHVDIDVPAQVDAPLAGDLTQQLEASVTSAMAAAGASGAVVGIWAPWSGSWVTGLGTVSATSQTAVTADTRFRAGMVTRAMTCDALYIAEGRGQLELDDTVADWVSSAPDVTDVTLEQLCDGTSGISAFSPVLGAQWLGNPERSWNPYELASYGLGQPRAAAAGAAWQGSDTGYVLLGLVLERATGQSASALLERDIFDPLDLTGTSMATRGPAVGGAGVLRGHVSQPDAEGVMNCTEPLDITDLSVTTGFTDTGVATTITDLGRYAQALATGALMPADAERLANPTVTYAEAPGWYTTAGGVYQAGSLIGQSGSVPGYATAAYADPATGLAVAVVLNNSAMGDSLATFLAWELAAIASKAPAASGETAPEAGLPWTAQQFHDTIAAAAVCPLPAP